MLSWLYRMSRFKKRFSPWCVLLGDEVVHFIFCVAHCLALLNGCSFYYLLKCFVLVVPLPVVRNTSCVFCRIAVVELYQLVWLLHSTTSSELQLYCLLSILRFFFLVMCDYLILHGCNSVCSHSCCLAKVTYSFLMCFERFLLLEFQYTFTPFPWLLSWRVFQ